MTGCAKNMDRPKCQKAQWSAYQDLLHGFGHQASEEQSETNRFS